MKEPSRTPSRSISMAKQGAGYLFHRLIPEPGITDLTITGEDRALQQKQPRLVRLGSQPELPSDRLMSALASCRYAVGYELGDGLPPRYVWYQPI